MLSFVLLCSVADPAFATESKAARMLEPNLKSKAVQNLIAYIPPQCFVKTELADKSVVNPCYVCHTKSIEPNYINDWDLQLNYSFPEHNLKNPWTNLFEDRTARVAAISDADILSYVRKSNYFGEGRSLILADSLRKLPPEWDNDNDGQWDGYTPDCHFNFNEQGYDLDPSGQHSGWRVYLSYPFPTSHWPSVGAPSDTLIRLPASFQKTAAGVFDETIYSTNLAIVEALISRKNVQIPPTDEQYVGVDLDKDGKLGTATTVKFDWAPLQGKNMAYAGLAGQEQQAGKQPLAAGLFPKGTELLKAMNYLDVAEDGAVQMAPRLRELRYMKKTSWQSYSNLEEAALAEMKEKNDFPSRTSQYIGNFEQGVFNGWGWRLQGFIENAAGRLRPQTYEETLSCVGCHGGVGATTDSVFSFSRKLDHRHFKGGWYHPQEKSLSGLVEPKIEIQNAGVFYEYSYYLMYNRAASDLRDNDEAQTRFFKPDGTVKLDVLNRLHDDVLPLLNPSPERALALNKAYKTIVEDQDYILGRDVQVRPLNEVLHTEVEADQPTGITQPTNTVRFGGNYTAGKLRSAVSHGQNRIDALPQTSNPDAQAFVIGDGSDGPDGERYEVNWQGEIAQSRYANPSLKDVFYTFPDRLTLPTRVIGPITDNPACYVCHRIPYPNVPTDNAYSAGPPENIAGPQPAWDRTAALSQGKGARVGGQWSPDGSQIAYVSNEGGSNQIWLMNADGVNERQLSTGKDIYAWPVWHPAGKELVVWSYDKTAQTHTIKSITVENGAERVLVSSQEHLDRPVWSPDGQWIAYAARKGDNWDLWLMRANGSDKRQLTHDEQMETNPLWRPDGQVIAYKVAPTGEYNLTAQYFMSFQGPDYTEPVVHTWQGPEAVQMNDWSPGGKSIVYTAEVVSASSGKERVSYMAMLSDVSFPAADGPVQTSNTVQLSQGYTLGDRGPVFSPDGDTIAYWAWDKQHNASLWLYDRTSKKTWPLTETGWAMYPQWHPGGKNLLFEQYQEGDTNLRLIKLE
ncbi:MAG: hypothetical protein GX087_01770 [Desulfobulbaceae bacterium]|nr:hypothetical protein [Desulfobulbaceae bacterium]